MSAPAINKDTALSFLDALAPGEPVVFQTFDDAESKTQTLARTIPGTAGVIPEQLLSLSQSGAGAFLCVNRTDDTGRRKAENITAIRALFVDFDTVDLERPERMGDMFKLEPSAVIESSAGKHHAYWFVDSLAGQFALEDFTPSQKALAAAFETDLSVNDLPRVMRLPGFIHQKGEPFQTRILSMSAKRYAPDELRAWIETLQPKEAPAPRQNLVGLLPAAFTQPRDAYAARALQNAAGAVMCAPEGQRNVALNKQAHGTYGLALAGRLDEWEVTQTLTTAAHAAGLSPAEIQPTLQSALQAATPRYEGLPNAANDYQHTGGIAWPGQPLAPAPQTAPIAGPRMKLTPVSELLKEPTPLQWLIKGYLLPGSSALLFGEPAAGKSLVGIDWAACIALGRDWNGHTVKPGPVVYLAGEGHHGISRRLKAWAIHHNAESDLKRAPIFVSERGGAMDTHAGLLEVMEAIDAVAEEYGPPALIMVDTLHRNMTGDENAAKDMSAYFTHTDALRLRYRAAVLTVHHSGHGDSKRARGSSAIKGAVDTELLVEVAGDMRTLKGTKQKDGPLPRDAAFQLEVITLPWLDMEGWPETSVVLTPTDAPPPRQRNMPPAIRTAFDAFLATAKEHGREDSNRLLVTLEDWRTHYYATHTGDTTEAKKKAFQRARTDMAKAHALAVLNDNYWLTPDTAIWPDLLGLYGAWKLTRNMENGTAGHDRDIQGTSPD